MYYIGVDLGGTNIAAGIVSEEGVILSKQSIPTFRERSSDAILKDLSELCLKLINDFNIDKSEVSSIGIGSPGSCDPKNGIILYSNNIHFANAPVREVVSRLTGLPVFVENDGNAAALGENISGAAKGHKHSITITLGTGVGGGIIIDSKIFSGPFNNGGEIGHHVIKTGGELCTCGRKGCFEAYSSATALIRDAKIAAIRNPFSNINKLVNNDINAINPKITFEAAANNDPVAIEVIEDYIVNLSEGIINLINIFQPEIIVIGGGISGQGENLLTPVRKYVEENVYGGKLRTKIVVAALGNDAGIVGSAMLGSKNK